MALQELIPGLLLVPLILMGVIVMFGPVMYVVSGWWRLARHYRTDEPAPPEAVRWVTGNIGGVEYGRSLVVAAEEEHLYVGGIGWLVLGHPAVRIPWSALKTENSMSGVWARVDNGPRIQVPARFLEAAPRS